MTPDLHALDRVLLRRLMSEHGFAFARPRDVGGYDAGRGSLHAKRLAQLARRGLLERKRINRVDARRPQYAYALTRDGARTLIEHDASRTAEAQP